MEVFKQCNLHSRAAVFSSTRGYSGGRSAGNKGLRALVKKRSPENCFPVQLLNPVSAPRASFDGKSRGRLRQGKVLAFFLPVMIMAVHRFL